MMHKIVSVEFPVGTLFIAKALENGTLQNCEMRKRKC